MSVTPTRDPIVRQFRQILMWPLQLMPLPRSQGQGAHHWQALLRMDGAHIWHEIEDEFTGDPKEFHERHYREFVTFLPHAQRFLYGQGRSSASLHGYGESPMRVFRRTDVRHIRLTFDDDTQLVLIVQHVDLYFYYEVDVVLLAFEYFADDVPLSRVQDIGFRFARAFPAQWDVTGAADQCMRKVEWLGDEGQVLATSDYGNRQAFLSHACEHRESRMARHWEFLLRPMVQHHSENPGDVRYRQLEYHRLPTMTYLSLDDPFALTQDDFFRLGTSSGPDDGQGLAYHPDSVTQFLREHSFDHYWVPERRDPRTSTRILCNARTMVMIGSSQLPLYTDFETGMLGKFRHQYALLGMIVLFHHAALLMFSDRMVLAVSRLDVDELESLERFRMQLRDTIELFLRFNHRYWFHEVSKESIARELFRMWSDQFSNDRLFQELREELLDMGQYLDSDANRKQSDIVLRLTAVTILGSIGTIATGFLGMNLIDETAQPLHIKVLYFLAVMIPSVALTLFTVMKSGPLAAFFDRIASERVSTRAKFKQVAGVFRLQRGQAIRTSRSPTLKNLPPVRERLSLPSRRT